MKANIVMAVIATIIALAQRIRQAWKESAKFRAMVKYVWESIKYYFGHAKAFVILVAEGMWNSFKTYFGAIGDLAKVLWDTIKAVFQKGKSPGEVFKEGFAEIVKDIGNIGKEAAEKYKETVETLAKPDYKKILASEKQISDAEEAAEKVGDAVKSGINKGIARIKVPEKIKGIAFGGISTGEIEIPELETEKLRAFGDGMVELAGKIKSAAIEENKLANITNGLQQVFLHTFENAKKPLQNFWKFFSQWIKNMIARIVALIAAVAVLTLILTLTGLGSIVGLAKGAKFGDIFKELSGGGVGKLIGGVLGMQEGGVTKQSGIYHIGEGTTAGELVSLPKFATVHPAGVGARGENININIDWELRGENLLAVIREVIRKEGNTT